MDDDPPVRDHIPVARLAFDTLAANDDDEQCFVVALESHVTEAPRDGVTPCASGHGAKKQTPNDK